MASNSDSDVGASAPVGKIPADRQPISAERRKTTIALLTQMHEHFIMKRRTYYEAHTFYLSIDRYLFYLPLVMMQATIAISTAVLSSQDSTSRYIAGIVTAASALLLGIQMHYKYSQVAEKFDNFASEFAMLATEVFYEMSDGAPSRDESHLELFIKKAKEVEKRILDVCPHPPEWLVEKVEAEIKREKRREEKKQKITLEKQHPPQDKESQSRRPKKSRLPWSFC